MKIIRLKFFILFMLSSSLLMAQLSLTGQLRTRSELRYGQGTLPEKNATPAFFTSQRTRINLNYSTSNFSFYTAVQDVRVWGQDISAINRYTPEINDGVMLHEAWTEIKLLDTISFFDRISLKIGRQELIYNDARLLGNLDWLQQGRRHDLALIKIAAKGMSAHIGFAYNQNKENKTGNLYNGIPASSPGFPAGYPVSTNGLNTMYKSMQFLFINQKLNIGKVSFLVIKDDFNKYTSFPSGKVFKKGLWSRVTGGADLELLFKNIGFYGSGYSQLGFNRDGNKINSFMTTAAFAYTLGKIIFTTGNDFLSGNNAGASGTNMAFDPLYGTAHKFWGYMDYFYVADQFGNGGLNNYYLKLKWKINNKIQMSLDLHEFYSAGKIANSTTLVNDDYMDKRLGTEADFILNYTPSKNISIESGYCIMSGTETLDLIKSPNVNKTLVGQWAYLMISVKPDFLNK